MITNIINISIYTISATMASGYSKIAIYTSASASGVFTELTTSATRVALVASTQYYEYYHTGSGIADNAYKFKYTRPTGASSAFITGPFYANTSDLTQDLRYEIEDITSPYRYTISELRRFIRNGIRKLQTLPYRRKFITDKDGIISPRTNEQDKSIIMTQSLIEVNKSQLTKAADTNISYSDGRGNFNNRSHQAIRDNIRDLISERDKMILSANGEHVGLVRCDMTLSGTFA